MRGQESIICAKMTEEPSKNGVSEIASGKTKALSESGTTNGALSPKLPLTLENTDHSRSSGGRLKIFKDGQLLLELSHQKEGERTSWVQVPKKPYWPPSAGSGSLLPAAVAGSSRQESSTSLSVSDDNSSIQSSPWQRDHCWKQQNPRRDLGRELTFYMRPKPQVCRVRIVKASIIHRKRRRPLDTGQVLWKEIDNFSDKPAFTRAIKNWKGKLESIIERLLNSAVELGKQSVLSSTKMDPAIVSPRKRILREFERVSLEDLASKRHKRPSAFVKSPSPPSVPTFSNNNSRPTAVKTKGNYNVPSCTPSPPSYPCNSSPSATNSSGKSKVEKLGSYSINSLLGKSDSDTVVSSEPSFLRSLLKSPSRTSGGCDLSSVATGSSSPSSLVHSPQPCQSPPDVRWSRPHKKKLSSPDTHSAMRLATATSTPPHTPLTNTITHHLSPHFISPTHPHMYHSGGFLPTQPPIISPHFYAPYPSHSNRSHIWPHPVATGLHYPGLLPISPWAHPPLGPPTPPQQSLLVEPGKREELAADMPLNLSKNAG